jgi:hypothetical protein
LPTAVQILIVALLFGAGALLVFGSALLGHRRRDFSSPPRSSGKASRRPP